MAKKDKNKENKDPKQQDAAKTEDPKGEAAKEDTKGKKKGKGKGKDKGKGGSKIDGQPLDRSKMTAEEFSQAQMEEAIKESQDPASKLKKIRSPFTVGNILINLLVLIVLTVGIVLLICYIMLDKATFNLWVVVKDIFDQYGITQFFQKVGAWFKKTFSGG